MLLIAEKKERVEEINEQPAEQPIEHPTEKFFESSFQKSVDASIKQQTEQFFGPASARTAVVEAAKTKTIAPAKHSAQSKFKIQQSPPAFKSNQTAAFVNFCIANRFEDRNFTNFHLQPACQECHTNMAILVCSFLLTIFLCNFIWIYAYKKEHNRKSMFNTNNISTRKSNAINQSFQLPVDNNVANKNNNDANNNNNEVNKNNNDANNNSTNHGKFNGSNHETCKSCENQIKDEHIYANPQKIKTAHIQMGHMHFTPSSSSFNSSVNQQIIIKNYSAQSSSVPNASSSKQDPQSSSLTTVSKVY